MTELLIKNYLSGGKYRIKVISCKIWSKWENRTEQRIMGGNNRKNKAGARKTRIRKRRAREKFQNSNAIFCYKSR